MFWFMWKQYRKQLYITVAIFLIYLGALLLTGIHLNHLASLKKGFMPPFSEGIMYIAYASTVVPLLLGMFWGVPLFAREYEMGTHNLALAQGITRRKWLFSKLAFTLLICGIISAILCAAIDIWGHAGQTLSSVRFFVPSAFTIQGIVLFGMTFFGVTMGAAAGAITRHTMPALAITIGVFGFSWYVIPTYLRPHYEQPVILHTVNTQQIKVASDGSYGFDNSSGSAYPPNTSWILNPGTGIPHCTPQPKPNEVIRCTTIADFKYQPANRFWLFQIIEMAVYLILSALAALIAGWAVLKRDL